MPAETSSVLEAQAPRANDSGFAKLFHPVIIYVWGYLPPTAQAVYPVLLRFADYRTRRATVSQERIGRFARRKKPMSQPQVSRAINEHLVPWGLVRVTRYFDQHNLQRAFYYLSTGEETLRHLLDNDLIKQEVLDEFQRNHGLDPDPTSGARVEGNSTTEELLERLTLAANSIEADIDDIY